MERQKKIHNLDGTAGVIDPKTDEINISITLTIPVPDLQKLLLFAMNRRVDLFCHTLRISCFTCIDDQIFVFAHTFLQ